MTMPKPYFQTTDGAITLYHGDCREILPQLCDFDLLLTDPPYGVDFGGKKTKHTKNGAGYHCGDNTIGPEIVQACLGVCKRGIVFPGIRILRQYPAWDDMGAAYCPSGAGMGRWGFACFHPILYYGPRPERRGMWPVSFETFATSPPNGHPCPKPLEWMEWCIRLAGYSAQTILDPFAGSGTTLVAARRLGRRAIGIELSEEYCEIAAGRLGNLSPAKEDEPLLAMMQQKESAL